MTGSWLYLYNNQFSGSLPSGIGKMNVERLYLYLIDSFHKSHFSDFGGQWWMNKCHTVVLVEFLLLHQKKTIVTTVSLNTLILIWYEYQIIVQKRQGFSWTTSEQMHTTKYTTFFRSKVRRTYCYDSLIEDRDGICCWYGDDEYRLPFHGSVALSCGELFILRWLILVIVHKKGTFSTARNWSDATSTSLGLTSNLSNAVTNMVTSNISCILLFWLWCYCRRIKSDLSILMHVLNI